MKVAVTKEIEVGERRVALIPDVVSRLVKQGWEIHVESGAGDAAFFSDRAYEEAGATIVSDKATLWQNTDIIVKVSPLKEEELPLLQAGKSLIGLLNPFGEPELIQKLGEKGINTFSLELMPRTSRAQSMDALSSQANIAGYKAVLLGATALPKFFPMLTTAAGTIRPATVFVIGVGVAGLQAIATARRLGALVKAFDIRPEVKEQVQSLGGEFVEMSVEEETTTKDGYAKEVSKDAKQKSQELIAKEVANADVVITTAQVQGKRAPQLVTSDMIKEMKPGSVIVDLAGEQGGNCEPTEAGKDIQMEPGITVIGPINVPSSLPVHASQMYSKNISTLLQYLVKDGQMQLDFEDDIIDGICLTYDGELRNQKVKEILASKTESKV
ncbi:Re/Si-specific NAD(P)(+) transhydrogenase subunit alpha [Euhalothece natronophila Z-M001]|uniref:NAD(P) transhydrogenase subunit alpha part 1 n=1 Tax=Euhalothece natronophila Z-M001 TaxID=522448 RepID=A0A5B8NRE7_9CHRO|nr:Re/Si-specific NAD(P)(+) transhydrogenase subunit alpha [Euhalothece natronophila]QDZ41071.1 Re/Si-specific NAD(P)(+) transhydrogenase subunit alpha [Euhalothece natronophila Z-M001]